MRILVLGASGFIGRALVPRLRARGHLVVGAGRGGVAPADLTTDRWLALDFTALTTPAAWRPYLVDVDVVVNATGIFRASRGQTFEVVHERAPCALFAACAVGTVQRIVQVSALGADAAADTAYHRTKYAADRCLSRQPYAWAIAQPSLVFGPDGESTQAFLRAAALPVLPAFGNGEQYVQPIHIDDLAAALVALAEGAADRQRVPLVGPTPMRLVDYWQTLRRGLGLAPARVVSLPMRFVRALAAVGRFWPEALLTPDSLRMLRRGNTAAVDGAEAVLGFPPRDPKTFLADAGIAREAVQWQVVAPLLRAALAFVWLYSGVVSLGLYPIADSLALLARLGLEGSFARAALYGAAILDIVFAWATWRGRPRAIWPAQIALILFYSLAIAWRLQEYWLHPFGPLAKNVPMLAVIFSLWYLDSARGISRR